MAHQNDAERMVLAAFVSAARIALNRATEQADDYCKAHAGEFSDVLEAKVETCESNWRARVDALAQFDAHTPVKLTWRQWLAAEWNDLAQQLHDWQYS